jgi:hypothetical protein
MLIIVDDVWDPAHAMPFIQCHVPLSTRLPAVADALSIMPETTYTLPVLNDDDGFKLLRLLAPDVVVTNKVACLDLVRDL